MKFENPIQLVVRNGDEPLVFNSDEDATSWLELQSSEWGGYVAKVSSAAPAISNSLAVITQHLNSWRAPANTARSQMGALTDKPLEDFFHAHFSGVRKQLSRGAILWVGDDLSQRAFSLAESEPESSVWIVLIALGHARSLLIDNQNAVFWAQFGRAMLHITEPKAATSFHKKQRAALASIEEIIASMAGRLNGIDEELVRTKNSSDGFFASTSSQSSSLFENLSKLAEEQRDEFSEEWAKLRAAYDAELKLSAPRVYWNNKFEDHGIAAANWRKALFAAAVCSFAIILLSVYSLAEGWVEIPQSMQGYGWVIPAVIVGVPSFLALWLLRLCARQWSDHLMRREDSRERIVMIETFLAISRSNDSPGAITDPAQLGLVLSSIFRPGPGMTTDDSPPAGFFEAMLTRFSAQSGPR